MQITPGFSAISSEDHAGYLWIVTALGAVYSCMTVLVRGRIKWGFFGLDDYLIGLATILYFAQCGVVFHGLKNGLAKSNHTGPSDLLQESGRAFLASEILSILCLCLAKCSCLALIMRVLRPIKVGFNIGWSFCTGTVALSAAWGAGSAIGVGARCEGSVVLFANSSAECPEQVSHLVPTIANSPSSDAAVKTRLQHLRWQIITALDVVTDALTSLIPAVLVIPLNMPLGDKIQVCVAFGFRLSVIPFSVLHLSSIVDFVHSTDPSLAITEALIMQQVMIFCSLLASTIPNMKGFMSSFSMGMGVKLFESETKSYPSRQSYALQTIGGSSTIKTPGKIGNVSGARPAKSGRDGHISSTEDSAYEIGNVDWGGNTSRRGSQERIIGQTDLYLGRYLL